MMSGDPVKNASVRPSSSTPLARCCRDLYYLGSEDHCGTTSAHTRGVLID